MFTGQTMSVLEACHIGVRMAAGLASLHRAGIQHWDLRPANVLLDEHGQAILAAAGFARRLHAMVPHPPYHVPVEGAGVSRHACAHWSR